MVIGVACACFYALIAACVFLALRSTSPKLDGENANKTTNQETLEIGSIFPAWLDAVMSVAWPLALSALVVVALYEVLKIVCKMVFSWREPSK